MIKFSCFHIIRLWNRTLMTGWWITFVIILSHGLICICWDRLSILYSLFYIIFLKVDEFGPVKYSRDGRFLMFTLSFHEYYVILNVQSTYDGQVINIFHLLLNLEMYFSLNIDCNIIVVKCPLYWIIKIIGYWLNIEQWLLIEWIE